MNISEFEVNTPTGQLTCVMAEPETDKLAAETAVAISVGGHRQAWVDLDEAQATTGFFVERGHRVVSFDMPNHGDLVDQYGQGIDGLCAAFVAGDDPFVRFVGDGRAVIDACVERGIAHNGQIFVVGGSRGGYCALRLMAADRRIAGAAALAPVTDWRLLKEFEAVKDRPEVAALALENWVDDLAGRPLFFAIGNHDHRVGTQACVGLVQRLLELEQPTEPGRSNIQLFVTGSPGHALQNEWRLEGARFLVRLCEQRAQDGGGGRG